MTRAMGRSHNENARCCLLLYAEINGVMTLIAATRLNTPNRVMVGQWTLQTKSVLFRELLRKSQN